MQTTAKSHTSEQFAWFQCNAADFTLSPYHFHLYSVVQRVLIYLYILFLQQQFKIGAERKKKHVSQLTDCL